MEMTRKEILNSSEYWQERAETQCFIEHVDCTIQLVDKQQFIDKVCEWIKDNASYFAHWEWNGDTYEKEVVFDTEECVEAFKQSIKEYLNYDTETDISN